MNKKVEWGVLGVAHIAVKKVIPAMQRGEWSQVLAIASRDLSKAQRAAEQLGIRKAYGSYEELLADPEVEAIYIPLPNHLHVPWSIRAAEAGKHVLCEKPVSLTVEEAISLLKTRDRTGVKIEEAFMIRTHPQWRRALDFIKEGRIGPVRSVMGYFNYYNRDLKNIRNILAYGGGALMDIGCYLVYTSRLIFGEEPARVSALIEVDPETRTDVITSAILHFPSGRSVFTCSTQLVPYQRVQIFGTTGRIEIEIPFNAPPDRPCRIFVDDGVDPSGRRAEILEFETCDQYTIQADLFSRSIREGTELPVPLEGSVRNMAVIEAIFRSAKSDNWETPSVVGL
ncbi:MAG: Gfo/Idh/MocA family oxidoreductase [Verrucomicrobia bacterium]|jgi:predicted dehydrogenase|nr:Gfo/Idh/MocA family oxidoreductase [Verrucomicrobiota bacterium]